MSSARREIIMRSILSERGRQFNLPGSEWDSRNTPNDWIAIATHYLSEEARRGLRNPPAVDTYEAALVKAAAVIIAGLEHVDVMKRNGLLSDASDQ
jgi:hypothetical protein